MMFKGHWSGMLCAVAVGLSVGSVWAKDEHRKHGSAPAHENKVHHAAPISAAPNHTASNNIVTNNAVTNNSVSVQTPAFNHGHHTPPQIHQVKVNQGSVSVGAQPTIQLPQATPRPQLQPGNGIQNLDLPKLQHQNDLMAQKKPTHDAPKGNPPHNPGGTGFQSQQGAQPKLVLPDPKHAAGLQHSQGQGTNKLPQFNPNQSGLPQLNTIPNQNHVPRLDPKNLGTAPQGNLAPNNQALGIQQGFDPKKGFNVDKGNAVRNFGHDHLPMKHDQPITGIQKQAIPLNVPKNGTTLQLNSKNTLPVKNPDQLQSLLQARDHNELKHNMEVLKNSPQLANHAQLQHLHLDKISGMHQDRLVAGNAFQHWQQSNVGHQLQLERQFQLQRQGDLTRQMNLTANVINAGGWQNRHHGAVAAAFTTGAFSVWYAGGGCYPTHCWYPRWSPWVSWCWWDTCVPFYDPRPFYCRPVVYQPCQPWVYYQYPVWQPLPVVTCGTWVNVQPVVIQTGMDLQLLAVRFVDNGHSEQNLGPRYRVWVRNNSPIQVTAPFSVLALASNDLTPTADLPQAGVVIPTMDIGEIKPIDIRLPLAANRLGQTPEGHRVPFNYLHVLVDSHQQIVETDESNNGSVVARTDILPVDPAAFSADVTAASPGSTVTIAGEGFGPEPGRVLVSVNGQQTEALIQGWYDLGVRFTVPNYNLTGTVDADVLVVRGDGAASNPVDLDLAPPSMLGQSVDFPAAPTPDAPQD